MGKERGKYKTSEVNHACLFAYNREHLVGKTFCKPCLGEYEADDDGSENEPDRRVHKTSKGFFRRPYEEK